MAKRCILYPGLATIGFLGFNWNKWLGVGAAQPLMENQSLSLKADNNKRQTDQPTFNHRDLAKDKRPNVGLGCLILRKNKDNELEFLIGIRKGSHGIHTISNVYDCKCITTYWKRTGTVCSSRWSFGVW